MHANYLKFWQHALIWVLATVNVDDAVDDMFRQLKGVSDGLLRRVGGPSPEEISQSMIGERQKPHSMHEILASRKLEQDSDEEYGEDEVADFMEGSASDDGNSNHFVPHGTRLDRGGSGGFSVEESTVGSDVCEEESSVPPEVSNVYRNKTMSLWLRCYEFAL